MNRGKQSFLRARGGYTIVEVLIFLAVSGLMFFMALTFIGGQQSRAQFTSSVRDFETKLADIANDVATGYYTKPTNFTCQSVGSGASRVLKITASASDTQGTNTDCVFAGTVIKFGDPSADERETFMQFAMAGFRTDSSGENITRLEDASPQPVFGAGSLANAVQIQNLSGGASVACVGIGSAGCTAGTNSPAAIGFFSKFSPANVSGQGNGIQTDVLPYSNLNFNDNSNSAAAKLAQTVNSANLNPAGMVICIQSGSTKQYALVRLGGSSGGLIITSEIKNFGGATPSCN